MAACSASRWSRDEVDEEGIRWGVLRAGDAMLCIYEYPDLEFVPRPRERGMHGINHFGLRITDRAAWRRRWRASSSSSTGVAR